MNYCKIGEKIRKFRKAKGFSQEFLAEKAGISVTHMSHIETGNTKLSLPVLVLLADALGVHTDDILYENTKSRHVVIEKLEDLLLNCTDNQIRMIFDIAKAAKESFDKYNQV